MGSSTDTAPAQATTAGSQPPQAEQSTTATKIPLFGGKKPEEEKKEAAAGIPDLLDEELSGAALAQVDTVVTAFLEGFATTDQKDKAVKYTAMPLN